MKYYLFSGLIIGLLILIGCNDHKETQKPPPTEEVSDDVAQITAAMKEMIDRLKEGDKTVLYESEFTYYKDEVPLSEYMELQRVKFYPYDSLSHIEVDSVELMGDSAAVKVSLYYTTAEAKENSKSFRTKFYRSQGRWVKPYMSRWPDEFEYLQRIKAYEEAVKTEKAGKEGQ
nr:hypothetical protein [candidate division Zixibacteria bacterium]